MMKGRKMEDRRVGEGAGEKKKGITEEGTKKGKKN